MVVGVGGGNLTESTTCGRDPKASSVTATAYGEEALEHENEWKLMSTVHFKDTSSAVRFSAHITTLNN